MTVHQKLVAAVFGISLLLVILELVRRRKLKVEYSCLWLIAGLGILVVGLNYSLLQRITSAIGAGWTSSAIFFLGIFFVLALSLQFSVKISLLENRVKNLTQEIAILRARKAGEKEREGDTAGE